MAERIFCPRCTWAPGPHDQWECRPGCRTAWNTFETRGRCPGCQKQWRVTECLLCHAGSPHEDWYHDGADDADAWDATGERDGELVEVGAPASRARPIRGR